MLTILFLIVIFGIFGKLVSFAFRMTWGIFKGIIMLIFLPLILIGLVVSGLIAIAIPALIVIGIVALINGVKTV